MNGPTSQLSDGVVLRVVPESLIYASIENNERVVTFSPAEIEGYRGQNFKEIGIREGSTVRLSFDEASGLVSSAVVTSTDGATFRNRTILDELPPPPRAPIGSGEAKQMELLPDDEASGRVTVGRALPRATRSFGKLIDTSKLLPGDLMLTRGANPDGVSRAIASVQADGGYRAIDARWAHAAMYLGDGASVVESTFDNTGNGVRITSLDAYSTGEDAIRFRRSRFLLTDSDRWRLCIRALRRLKDPYDFGSAIGMWFKVVLRGGSFGDDSRRQTIGNAVVCSTLYADAYNETTRRSLGELSGACVPAWLSATNEFADVKAGWLSID